MNPYNQGAARLQQQQNRINATFVKGEYAEVEQQLEKSRTQGAKDKQKRKHKLTSVKEKYKWGHLIKLQQGSDWSMILHPEHHEALRKLKAGEEHEFTDETRQKWKVKHEGDGKYTSHAVNNAGGNMGYHGEFDKDDITPNDERGELTDLDFEDHKKHILDKYKDEKAGDYHVKGNLTRIQYEKYVKHREAGIKPTAAVNKVLNKSVDDELEKGGEGSKGGKVIGHTKSGKAIYEHKNANHNDYKDFTANDHNDALQAHADNLSESEMGHFDKYLELRKKESGEKKKTDIKKGDNEDDNILMKGGGVKIRNTVFKVY
jgi:hypothetical protein